MAKSSAEWMKAIAEEAEAKGFWEPKCQHPQMKQIVLVVNQDGDKPPLAIWCEDCGAHSSDGGYFWTFPKIAKERNRGEMYMLFVSEIAEAFEEHRNNHTDDDVYYIDEAGNEQPFDLFNPPMKADGSPYKPEGQLIEICDTYIRMDDAVGHYWTPELLERAREVKFAYNKSRGHRHGNKAA